MSIDDREIRLLIIDDDEVDRMAIRRSVGKAGIRAEIDGAESIKAAWQAVRTTEYDCIFLDYRLPGGDGLELLQQFRRAGYTMPIIVVTSQGDEKIAVQVMKSGGSDYISKRLINPEGISQILRNAIRTHIAEQDRRRTAIELTFSQARLAEAQRIANIGSWEVEPDTGNRFWSEQVYVMLGYDGPSAVEPNQDLFARHIHPEDLPTAEDYLRRCIIFGEHFRFDMRVVTTSGEIRHVEIQGGSIRDNWNRTVKVVGTIQDIHERKQIERELIEARDIAERSAKSREEFLANMSHEIRTPMNAIIGFTKLLYDSPLNPEQLESLKAIDAAGEALIAIINDILDLSKIEAGMLRFEEKPFGIEEVLQSLTGIFRARANEKSIRLETFVGPDVPPFVTGDRARLNQVLINLMGNAIKFTPEGEVSVSVKLMGMEGETAHLLFEVQDTGIGIPLEKQNAIFDSFTQASNETTRKYGGTGLGLTICKRIVELQGGRIGVVSEPGSGSTFYFDLQFQVAESGGSAAQKPVTDTRLPIESPETIRVLLAEDNVMNQRLAGRVLERLGYEYEIAENGRMALELLASSHFDVVLMDIQMPEMDGYQASRQIRRHENEDIRRLPIIALTAHALIEEVDRCKAAGMDEFISKPFQPEVLRDKIRQLVGNPPLREPLPSSAFGRTTDHYAFIRLDALEELAGGSSEFKLELIDIFMEEAPAAVEQMHHGLETRNGELIYRAMHSLKPSLIMFDIRGQEVIVPGIETQSQLAELPVDGLKTLIHRLEKSLEGAFAELEKEKAKLERA